MQLLLWDASGEDGAWNMCAEEDSSKVFDINVSSLLLTGGDTVEGVPTNIAVRPLVLCCCVATQAKTQSLQ